MSLNLDAATRKIIVERRHFTLDKRIANRLSVLLWVADGRTQQEAADLLGVSSRQVRKWLHTFRTGGLKALCTNNLRGDPGKLTPAQIDTLKAQLATGRFFCAQQICDWVSDTFSIVYSARGMRDLLRRIRVSFHKGTGFFWRASPQKQEDHLRKHEQQKAQAVGTSTRRYYVDACHPVWGTNLLYSCWLPIGHRLLIGVGGGRKRLNILGAYCPDDREYLDIRLTKDNINAQQFVNLLERIRSKHPETEKIILYLDNARYFHCEFVKEWLSKHPEFQLEHLPPYSPNLNLIERMWKFVKKTALRRWHKTFEDMQQGISDVLDHLDQYASELASLMVERFQRHPLVDSPQPQSLAA